MTCYSVVHSKPVWDSYEPTAGDEKPPPRSHHVLVTIGQCIVLFVRLSPSPSPIHIIRYRFGGTNTGKRYNDTWLFDTLTRKWTELACTGCIPSPRCSHAAALVGDVMYVFGGLDVDKRYLGDLIGLNLSSE